MLYECNTKSVEDADTTALLVQLICDAEISVFGCGQTKAVISA